MSSGGVKALNPNAEVMGRSAALYMNINAAKGLHDIMKTNLGPKGTIKMLVGGAGDIKLTKDGNVLLREMQIQNPTAVMIARTAVAQDDVTGDGTTSIVLMIGELMKQSERYLSEGLHPRVLVEAPAHASVVPAHHTHTRTFVGHTQVEIMHMRHKLDTDTRLIRGLVLDHGSRHPDMPQRCDNAFILSCNISLEYEKSEVNSGFFYSSADQREKLVAAERAYTDQRVQQVIDLKRKVCTSPDQTFVVINQKGIDPLSLDMLAKEGIMALRRAKKRNMERLQLACGGFTINSVEELLPEALGHAGSVYEHTLGDDKYTFIEDVANPHSCTILIKGQNDHTIAQMKDAVRDGLRAVKNVVDDGAVILGGGAFEVAAALHLKNVTRKTIEGRVKLGLDAFAEALLGFPKILAENSGYDAQEVILKLQEEQERGNIVGLDVSTGEPMEPAVAGVYDNYIVKRQIIQSAPVLSSQLLLVDEVLRAGMNMRNRTQ
ncbi:MAG: hypothetical protein WDW38_010170 [Sanguina aurantia]